MITLHGIQYQAASPSLLHQLNHPVSIGYDGRSWLIYCVGAWGTREFASRDEAAQLIAQAFTDATRECLG